MATISYDKKLQNLLTSVHTKTTNGDLKWEETEKETEFQVSFPNQTLRIGYEEEFNFPDIDTYYYLTIYNNEGKVISKLTPSDFESGSAFGNLKEIYENARKISLGLEKALDDLLANLES